MNQTLKHLKYGDIECMVKYPFNKPTKETFNKWKKEFFKLEESKLFNIYLTGSFAEKLSDDNTECYDIDIILTGCDEIEKIEKLVYEGTKLGFEKYNTFFDILWFDELPIYCEMKKNQIKLVQVGIISPEFLIDGVNINNQFKYKKQIGKNLWTLPCSYPTQRQLQKMNNGYNYSKPMLIN